MYIKTKEHLEREERLEIDFQRKKKEAQEAAMLRMTPKTMPRENAIEEINRMASALVVSAASQEEDEESWKKIKTMFPHYNEEYKTNHFYINLKNMFINSPYFDKDGNKLKSLDFTRI